ncbi:plastid movement impaired1 [Wolffia australiana]
MSDRGDTHLLQELEALSQTLHPPRARRTTSLALPRDHAAVPAEPPARPAEEPSPHRPRARRMSLSPWRARPNPPPRETPDEDDDKAIPAATTEKKGIWGWKPIRALSHIGMQKLGCLFSVEVISIHGLHASVNGLRLSVAVRKKETKDGAVQTMPSRVLQGVADFDETLFLRCHVYCSGGKQPKFEPRPLLVYAKAVDAPELDFGKSPVDLSQLVKESMEKNFQGVRVRQWERRFKLSGKAKGGELTVKLGFQLMDDGSAALYGGAAKANELSSSSSRQISKNSFSISSPRPVPQPRPPESPAIDDFLLDEPATVSSPRTPEDHELPEFDVVEKGVEIKARSEDETDDDKSAASEAVVVKEVVEPAPDPAQQRRLTELDSIAKQIEALESIMARAEEDDDKEEKKLDVEEETLTREWLHMLDGKKTDVAVARGFVPELGKGLGAVIQTKDGGFLAAINPSNAEIPREDAPKLAMQISKPLVLKDQKGAAGFELFQRMAAMGAEELSSRLQSLSAMEELVGKTAGQIAFEGVASAVISGRNKDGGTSGAAKSVTAAKAMAAALEAGRKERALTGIWNASETAVPAELLLSVVIQKVEAMAMEALKIQADMAEDEAPFDVLTLAGKDDPNQPLASAVAVDELTEPGSSITLMAVVQVRDPQRRYETVGAPVVAIAQASASTAGKEEEATFMVESVHVAGIRVKGPGKKSGWDGETQRLTAAQWLVTNGMGRAGKKSKATTPKAGQDTLWSMSSRVMAGIWLKQVRNPDVKFPRQA